MSLIDQTVSSQTKSLWHQRPFLLLWIASSTGYSARLVVRLALPLVAIRLTTSPLLVSGVTFALKDFSWSTRPYPIAVCS
jgi:hypothetical protein